MKKEKKKKDGKITRENERKRGGVRENFLVFQQFKYESFGLLANCVTSNKIKDCVV